MTRRVCGLFNLMDFLLPSVYLIDSQKRNKLKFKSKKCIFIGFTKEVKVFRLWDLEKKSVVTSRDVFFDKKSMLREKSETEDRAQGGASDSSADTQEKELSSQIVLKSLKGQKRTSQTQMETNKRLLKSNVDR